MFWRPVCKMKKVWKPAYSSLWMPVSETAVISNSTSTKKSIPDLNIWWNRKSACIIYCTPVLKYHPNRKPASSLEPGSFFHFALHLEAHFFIKVEAGFRMNSNEETGIKVKVESSSRFMYASGTGFRKRTGASFQFMYDLGTCVILNPDTSFYFIRPTRGSGRLTWSMGMEMGVSSVKTVHFGTERSVLYVSYRQWSSNLYGIHVNIQCGKLPSRLRDPTEISDGRMQINILWT